MIQVDAVAPAVAGMRRLPRAGPLWLPQGAQRDSLCFKGESLGAKETMSSQYFRCLGPDGSGIYDRRVVWVNRKGWACTGANTAATA